MACSPLTSQMSRPAAAGSARPDSPPSQSPLSRRIARAAVSSISVRASALARTSPGDQVGSELGDRGDGLVEVVVCPLGRVLDLAGHERVRQDRRIQQDQRRGPDAGRRQVRGDDRAVAVADDLEVRPVDAGRADPALRRPRPCRERDAVRSSDPSGRGPGRSGASTRRPVAARAGPTRHQIAADAVTPWSRTSGRAAGSPQASTENGMPAASTTRRSPGAGSASAEATAAGRSATVATIGSGRARASGRTSAHARRSRVARSCGR